MVVIKVEPWDESTSTSPPQVESQEMFGFQDLASDYYQVIRQKERPKWCRIVWGVVILVLVAFTGFMVYQLLADYFQYKSFVESSITWVKNVTLPAITICNTNPLNYTRLKKKLKKENNTKLLEEFDHLMEQYVKGSTQEDGYLNINFTEFDDFNTWEHKEGSLVLRFKPHLYHMLFGEYDYIFRGIGNYIDSSDYFKYSQMTELGVCFELNDDGSLQQTSGGMKGGLVVDLDANIDHYLITTASKGFVIFIRDQDETIMMNRGGYMVSPGSETFLKLTVSTHTRLGEPHGTCQNVPSQFAKYDHHYESVRECVQRHKMEVMVDMCHCIPWYLAERLFTLGKTDVLDAYTERLIQHHHKRQGQQEKRSAEEDVEEDAEEDAEISTASPTTTEEPLLISNTEYSHLACGFVEMYICDKKLEAAELNGEIELNNCPEPCTYHEWGVETASTLFPPSEEYFDRFLKYQLYMPEPPTYEFIQNNMARVHIYYDELKVNNMVQTKAYEPQNFIAEFGGTVDLFIGFSFFTVFQLIEIAIAFCLTKLWQRRRDSNPPEGDKSTAFENSNVN